MMAAYLSRLGMCVLMICAGTLRGALQTNEVFGFTQSWRYETNNLEVSAWSLPDHDDSLWASGGGLLCIEDALLPAPKISPLPARPGGDGPLPCYYFRTTVVLSNTPAITALVFSNLIDDGAVFYLNGVEVKRVAIGDGRVTNTTPATRDVGDATSFDTFALSGPVLATLREGTNVVAAEVHQATSASPDVVFGCSLTTVSDQDAPTFLWLVAPASGQATIVGTALSVTAAVSQVFGNVSKVTFMVDGKELGTASSPPYSATWISTSLGSHTLSAVALGSGGARATSQVVTVWITPPPPPKLARGPYLQSGTPNSVWVCWRTDVASQGRVVFGTNLAQLDQTVAHDLYTTNHALRLANLLPATRYYYSLNTDAGPLAPAHEQQYYQTAPPSGTPAHIRIWAIGDAGTADLNARAVRDAYYSRIGTNHTDVWLQLGDNAYPTGTDAQYQQALFVTFSNLLPKTVTWPTVGNHDTTFSPVFSPAYPYFQIFELPTQGEAGGVPSGGEQYYSFNYGNVHFICLDSMASSLATNGPMANWLRADLAANTNLWVIAFCHHPPYSKGSHDSDTESTMIWMRQNLVPILEAGGADLLLAGHSHVYERTGFLDGHYGASSNLAPQMFLMSGGGQMTNGASAYIKPPAPRLPHQGTVYAVVGSSGMVTPGPLGHPAMIAAGNVLGSVCLEIQSNRLDYVFLRETGAIDDAFTLIKEPMTNRMDLVQPLGDGGRLVQGFGVPGRVYVIEVAENLDPPQWRILGSARAASDGTVSFTDSDPEANGQRFYRARQ